MPDAQSIASNLDYEQRKALRRIARKKNPNRTPALALVTMGLAERVSGFSWAFAVTPTGAAVFDALVIAKDVRE